MRDNVVTPFHRTLNVDIGVAAKNGQEGDPAVRGRCLRLLADVKSFLQQLDETKLDNNIRICAFLKVPSAESKRIRWKVNLDRLIGSGGHRDGEVLTWLGWIWRYLYRLYLDRVAVRTCLPVSGLLRVDKATSHRNSHRTTCRKPGWASRRGPAVLRALHPRRGRARTGRKDGPSLSERERPRTNQELSKYVKRGNTAT